MADVTYKSVRKEFGDVVALQDFSLQIADGEFVVLVGPSGSGKTTALRLLAGLEAISKGEIRVGDRLVNRVAPQDRDIAMVFQDYALYPQMTVYDNLAFGLKMRKIPKDEIRKRVEHAAELLDIGELLERKPRALSGGQRQRVALGRALVREPAAFLMDEPLSNLDAKLRVQTRSEIKQLQRQVGTTTVYVTHDQVEAMTMGDRVAVMNNGLLEQVGDTRTVYEHPANVFVAGFIGSPGMTFATLDASRNGGPVTLARGGVSLSVDPAGATEPLPGEVTIGIRPEHAHVWRDGGDLMGPIEGTVTFVEMLGREALLGVQVGDDQRFTVFADADAQTAIGDLLSFGIERGRLYLFDPTDEHALGVV
ncbi:MAG TPA: sn-glycerol-3-phosphate ABC transporter ATP-binding protein UgpC [Actinomycetota bacterium]|jgi:ABC-type sugar transport system ATPase subunit|nr:sn-glycerol-3-phosphate ABC transporter ATP-binding protein UgpC [Actinomycetota bacterium]